MQGDGKKREATGLVECSWCDAVFLTEEMLARHLLLHHLQWNTNCAVCGDQLNNSVMRSVVVVVVVVVVDSDLVTTGISDFGLTEAFS